MPTQPYRTKDGKRVPSVTTICGRFKESGGLIHWSWNLAYEPLMQARSLLVDVQADNQLDSAIDNFLAIPMDKFDYRAERDAAADAGTVAHDMVECFIRNKPFDLSKYQQSAIALAEPAFQAFKEWAQQSKLEVVETEKPLVSEVHRFGGTRDAIMVSGKRAMGDWKSSKDIYPEYLCQLAAYGILDEEAGNTIDGGYHLIRFSKQEKPDDPVNFSHHFWSHLDAAKESFLLMRKLYDLMSQVKGYTK